MITYKRRQKIKRRQLARRQTMVLALIGITIILIINIIHWSQQPQKPQVVISKDLTIQPNKSNQNQLNETVASEVISLRTTINKIANESLNFEVPSQFQGTIISKLQPKTAEKVIALTFDDGPWGKTTLEVLDILKKNDIKATFFMVGQPVKNYPDIARQVVTEGHAIGNHTWHHRYNKVNEATAAKEINDTADIIYKTTGVKTAYFRPPGGALKNGLAAYAQKNHYAVMMWSVDSTDSHPHRPDAQKLVNSVLKNAKSGGIVLLHDGGGNHTKTVQALPQIISELKQQGYKFVTLPQLLEISENQSENVSSSPTTEIKKIPTFTDTDYNPNQ